MREGNAGRKFGFISIKVALFNAILSAFIVGLNAAKVTTLYRSGLRDDYYWYVLLLWAAITLLWVWQVLRVTKSSE